MLGTNVQRREMALMLQQDHASVYVDQLGSIRVIVPARGNRSGSHYELPVIIEEEITERLQRALRFTGWALASRLIRKPLTRANAVFHNRRVHPCAFPKGIRRPFRDSSVQSAGRRRDTSPA
jgi:hypothetical protein